MESKEKQPGRKQKQKSKVDENANNEKKPIVDLSAIEKDKPEFIAHRLRVLEEYLKNNPQPQRGTVIDHNLHSVLCFYFSLF